MNIRFSYVMTMNSDCLNVYALFSGLISKYFTVRRRMFEELLTVQLHVNSVYEWHKQSMHSMFHAIPCHCVRVIGALTAHRTHNVLHNIIFILTPLNIPSIHWCVSLIETHFSIHSIILYISLSARLIRVTNSSIHSFVHSKNFH